MFKKHPRIPELEMSTDGIIRHARTKFQKPDRDVIYHLGNTHSTALVMAETFLPNPHGYKRAERINPRAAPAVGNIRWCSRTREQQRAQPRAGEEHLYPQQRPRGKTDTGRAVTDGNKVWHSVTQAAWRNKIDRGCIHRSIRTNKPHRGVQWRYADAETGEELL